MNELINEYNVKRAEKQAQAAVLRQIRSQLAAEEKKWHAMQAAHSAMMPKLGAASKVPVKGRAVFDTVYDGVPCVLEITQPAPGVYGVEYIKKS